MLKQVQLLDCTLRDGGLGLEDAYKNKISNVGFSEFDSKKIIEFLNKAKLEIIELVSIELSQEDKTRFAIYQNIEEVSKKIPQARSHNQMFVGLFRGPDTPIEDIPKWNPSLVDGLRVIIRYSELKNSLDFCAALSKKGYKVFVQPMLTMRYTDEEIAMVINAANNMDAYALYFVDSYGYMAEDDVIRMYRKFNKGLKDSICIGFHAHNNMNLAFSNVKTFIAEADTRKIIIDSCATGMGQGAGNLQTELIVPYLMQKQEANYNFDAVLNVCEILDKYFEQGIWGYSVTRLIPAIHKS